MDDGEGAQVQLRDGGLTLSPSDVTGFLSCRHLTTLDLRAARAGGRVKTKPGEQAELVFRKGMEHERAYLAQLAREGSSIVEISLEPQLDWELAQQQTIDAMRAGADVVYQGVFTAGNWRGVADFLLRVPAPSALGEWSYEALDTKLARSAKPAYILQLCFYNDQLGRLQGQPPEWIHVLLGSGELAGFRPEEFGAYYRRVRSRLVKFLADRRATEPDPN